MFQMKPEYLNGNVIPMESFCEVTVIHKFKVLKQRHFNRLDNVKIDLLSNIMENAPRNGDLATKKDHQKILNVPIKYYLGCNIKRKYDNINKTAQHYFDSLSNVYVLMVFPLATKRKFLQDPLPTANLSLEESWERYKDNEESCKKKIKLEHMEK